MTDEEAYKIWLKFSDQDRDRFLKSINNPPKPNKSLKKLMKNENCLRCQEMIVPIKKLLKGNPFKKAVIMVAKVGHMYHK